MFTIGYREMMILGRLFDQEIALAVAPKGERLKAIVRIPKAMKVRMIEKGLIQDACLHVGRDAFGDITVFYYALTPEGRFYWCRHCASCPDEEES